MSAQLMPMAGTLNEKQTALASQIESCSTRITDIVSDLLDLTRARQGGGLPVTKKPMDIGILARELVDEMDIQYPNHTILLETTGDMHGDWDIMRLGQLFSNLMGNALQYGSQSAPVSVAITGDTKEIVISVHNVGNAIPPSKLTTIFDSFTRGDADGNKAPTETSNLGLGLFITREIVLSHDGTINVSSTETEGTAFTVRLPRFMKNHEDNKLLGTTATKNIMQNA